MIKLPTIECDGEFYTVYIPGVRSELAYPVRIPVSAPERLAKLLTDRHYAASKRKAATIGTQASPTQAMIDAFKAAEESKALKHTMELAESLGIDLNDIKV